MSYSIYSPDGFTIEREPSYETKEKAEKAFKQWIKTYERQGYYSSVRHGKIPLNELENYCKFVCNEELNQEHYKPFNISSFCKADLLTIERNSEPVFNKSDIENLTDLDMEAIASKLSDDYCEQLFWSSLEIITENVISRKKQ
jgi:hypothetical protein